MLTKKEQRHKILDIIGFGSIAAVCYFYSVFWSTFAEIHIRLPYLNFPIFVGEILLFECALLLFSKWWLCGFKFKRKYVPILLYFLWVLYRALFGYYQWGPLALRNAALFYYPLFMVIAYHFFRKEYLHQKIYIALFFILIATKIAIGISFKLYANFPYFILMIILLLKMRISKYLKAVAFGALIILFPPKVFFEGSRSFTVANSCAFLFIFIFIIFGILKIKLRLKIAGLILSLVIMILALVKYTAPEKLKSMMRPTGFFAKLEEFEEVIAKNKDREIAVSIPIKIYNPNTVMEKNETNKDEFEREKFARALDGKLNDISQKTEEEIKKVVQSENATERLLDNFANQTMKKTRDEIKRYLEIADNLEKDSKMMEEEVMKKEKNFIENLDKSQEEFKNKKISSRSDLSLEEEVMKKEKNFIENLDKSQEEFKNKIISSGEIDKKDLNLLYSKADFIIKKATQSLKQQCEVIVKDHDDNTRSRGLSTEYGNMVFRLLIWRDMFREIVSKKAWFGINFGRPLRSSSIEKAGFARGEWSRDGWIAPHNSFLHVIYRAGILGLAAAFAFFTFLGVVMKEFIKRKSLEGLLAVSILIYTIVLANFLVVLEMPYQAIPFWSWLGIILAYLKLDHGKEYKG